MSFSRNVSSALLFALLVSSCSDDRSLQRSESEVDAVLRAVVEQVSKLPTDLKAKPWALLLEKEKPPFGVVKILPLGEYKRIDLTRDCSALYAQLSVIVLHAPEELSFRWATNYGTREPGPSEVTVLVEDASVKALPLAFDLEIHWVDSQLLGFELSADDRQLSSDVKNAKCD